MEQSPSSEGNRFSAILEIPGIFWNPKFITALQVSATCPYPEPGRLYNVIIQNIAMKTLHNLK